MSVREGYKQTEIGVIPEEWEVVNLSDIANVNMGQSPKSATYNEEGIGLPLIQGNADCKNRKTEPRIFTSEPTKTCSVGNIIMTVRAPVGAVVKSYHNACIGRGVCAITAKEDEAFLYQLLIDYEDKWEKLSQGSTFTAVNGTDVKSIKLPKPPLPEQQKIAAILTSVDNKIEVIDEQIAKTEALKKGLMQKLLSEGIGHMRAVKSDDNCLSSVGSEPEAMCHGTADGFKESEIGRIPKGWEVVRLGEVIGDVLGGVSVNSEDRSKNDNEIGILKTSAISMGKFYPEQHKTVIKSEYDRVATNPLADHIIFSRMNTPNLVGESGYVPDTYSDLYLPDRLWQLSVSDKLRTYAKWLSYVLISERVKKILMKSATGTSNSMKNISKPNLLKIKIAHPSFSEQKQIATILSTTDNKLDTLREKKLRYEKLKKGLMQKLLTGEVRVNI